MIQDILVCISVTGALLIATLRFLKFFVVKRQSSATCGGCSGCTPKQVYNK